LIKTQYSNIFTPLNENFYGAAYFKETLRTLKMDFIKKNLFNGAGYSIGEEKLIVVKKPLTSIGCRNSETFN